MAIIFFLITIALGILMILGFFNPNISLFWLSENKTKLKSFLIYGISAFCFFIFFLFSIPKIQNLNNLSNEEITNREKFDEAEKKELNENVAKWFSLSSKKKEKYIENKILGTWSQIQLLSAYAEDKISFISNKNYQTFYKEKGNFVFTETYIEKDGFFDFPHITTLTMDEKGKKEEKGFWMVEDDKLNISFLVEKENYNVIYISDILFIKSITEPLTKSIFWEVYINPVNFNQDEINSEITKIYIKLLTKSSEGITKGIEEIKAYNNEDGYNKLISNYKNLGITALINNEDIEQIELIKNIPNDISEEYKVFINQKINEFSTKIQNLENNNENQYFLKKYADEFESLKSYLQIGNVFNLENKRFRKQIAEIEKDFSKRTKEFNIFGNLSETLMEIVAEDYIKKNAKDPKSIKLIESRQIGKTNNGIKYYVKYRGKNSFGAYDISSNVLLLRWNISAKIYEVAKIM